MNIEQTMTSAMAILSHEIEAVQADLEKAVARSVDERTRDAGENAQKHPLNSSTTLKEAYRRAKAAEARLEKRYGPVIGSALESLVAIAFAKQHSAQIESAIIREEAVQHEKAKTGLYPAAQKGVDRMYAFGGGKWHWAQMGDPELMVFSDLLRWKAEDPGREDPNNPWLDIDALYEQRRMPAVLGAKLALSLPRNPQSGSAPAKLIVQTPRRDEMIAIAGEWAWYITHSLRPRTAGVGRLETDDPYGGFLRCRAQDGARPMRDREDLDELPSGQLGAAHWNRFDVPRSAYAVVEVGARFDFPDLPQLYPPVANLRLIGITLNYGRARQQDLEEAEAGKGSSEIIIETVRRCFLQHNSCHDEDLIRFWLFLLVGRKYPDRVDALFPPGYFHGVRGPDAWESRHGSTHFQLVRVAADRNFKQVLIPLAAL